MLLISAIIIAFLITAVALRFLAGPDEPDNGIEHHQQDAPRDDGDPDPMLAAA